jgi:hypothetical protein
MNNAKNAAVTANFVDYKNRHNMETHMYSDEQIHKLIDELMRKRTTRSAELSDILERDRGVRFSTRILSARNLLRFAKIYPVWSAGQDYGMRIARFRRICKELGGDIDLLKYTS